MNLHGVSTVITPPKISPHLLYFSFFILSPPVLSLSASFPPPCKRTSLRELRDQTIPLAERTKTNGRAKHEKPRGGEASRSERERERERLDACTSAWYRGHASEIKRGDIEHAYYEAQRADAKFGWSGAGSASVPGRCFDAGRKEAREETDDAPVPRRETMSDFFVLPRGNQPATQRPESASFLCVSPLLSSTVFFRLLVWLKAEFPFRWRLLSSMRWRCWLSILSDCVQRWTRGFEK